MLPPAARLRQRDEFSIVFRRGRRVARGPLVVHALTSASDGVPARVGFVIGKPVGGAVVRNRLRRRLRHLMRDRLAALPTGATVVVRAQPGAGELGFDELARLVDAALERLGLLRGAAA